MKVPNKDDRKKCYTARDNYFVCLDKNELWLEGLKPESYEEVLAIDPTKPPLLSQSDKNLTKLQKDTLFTCSKLKLLFKEDCLPSWFLHFSMLRVNELQKKEMFEKLKEKDRQLKKENKEFWRNATESSGRKESSRK